ncbi:hypothetical protein D3C73_1483650 [compost metagenome]
MIAGIVDERSPFRNIGGQIFLFLHLKELGARYFVDVHGDADFGKLGLDQHCVVLPVLEA